MSQMHQQQEQSSSPTARVSPTPSTPTSAQSYSSRLDYPFPGTGTGASNSITESETTTGRDALVHLNDFRRSDIVIRLSDNSFHPCHKSYLLRLPRFQQSLQHFRESESPIVDMDIPVPHHFRPFLEHIYMNSGNAIDSRLFVKEVLLDTLRNAIYLDMEDIIAECVNCFPQHWRHIIQHPEFNHRYLHSSTLSDLLTAATSTSIPTPSSPVSTSTLTSTSSSTQTPTQSSSLNIPSQHHQASQFSNPPTIVLTSRDILEIILTWSLGISIHEATSEVHPLMNKHVKPLIVDGTITLESMAWFVAWLDGDVQRGDRIENQDTSDQSGFKIWVDADADDVEEVDSDVYDDDGEDIMDHEHEHLQDASHDTMTRHHTITNTNPDTPPATFNHLIPAHLLLTISAIQIAQDRIKTRTVTKQHQQKRHKCKHCGIYVTVAEVESKADSCVRWVPAVVVPTAANSTPAGNANRNNVYNDIGVVRARARLGEVVDRMVERVENGVEGVVPGRRVTGGGNVNANTSSSRGRGNVVGGAGDVGNINNMGAMAGGQVQMGYDDAYTMGGGDMGRPRQGLRGVAGWQAVRQPHEF
ncbi:hypothetical protein HDU76_006321 [Blyttiomyces sp. JEL0837]|nr:hypothetical protein HDU76_006321 [Blyttiomyces sp. JEL0837]